jgi:hypothetical protein
VQAMANRPSIATQLYGIQRLIVSSYTAAGKEWESLFATAHHHQPENPVSNDEAFEHLAMWLNDTHIHSDDRHTSRQHLSNPDISGNLVALYTCSHCRNPSASLRKCGGCSKARYAALNLPRLVN